MDKEIKKALTFDDVLIIPKYSEILPKDSCLKTSLTKNIKLNIPLISAAMDTVTEAKLAIALASEGGIGIIHKNMSIEKQASEVSSVKRFEAGIINNPITIKDTDTLKDVVSLQKKHKVSALPVTKGSIVVGIITSRDIRFVSDLNKSVKSLMTPQSKLITVKKNANKKEIVEKLKKHKIERVLICDNKYHLQGMVTVRDMLKSRDFPNACKDKQQRLRVGAAVGIGKDSLKRSKELITNGVDILAVDTAHGHSKGVIDLVKKIKKEFSEVDIIAGNVATAQAAIDLEKAGVDAVKVGIGPGSICTTRIISGIGMPQITAIYEVAKALKKSNVKIIADGGIRFMGDVAKALVAGADSVMLGNLFAGTDESAGNIEYHNGRAYKSYRGMGSLAAMQQKHGSSDRYFQNNIADNDKLVPEGVEGCVPYKGAVRPLINQIIGSLRATMGYTNSATIQKLQTAKFVEITAASFKESHIHNIKVTKESSNYYPDT